MRVLLTGASGFLGVHVLPLLEGHDVLCLTRNPGTMNHRAGVRAVAADLTSGGEWTREVAVFRPDWCLHLAWQGLPDYSLDACRVNLDASLRLLDVTTKAGVKRVVVAGSCWEYGQATGAVGEETVPRDPGVFAATKQALLSVLDAVSRSAGVDYRWARIFFVYGPGQRPTSLLPSLHAAHAEGRAPEIREPGTVQDFVHVDDVAAALVTLAACDAPSGVFNVGTGTPASVGSVVNRAARYYGAPQACDASPGGGFWADMTRTTALTGWRARIGLDAGIDSTLSALDGAA